MSIDGSINMDTNIDLKQVQPARQQKIQKKRQNNFKNKLMKFNPDRQADNIRIFVNRYNDQKNPQIFDELIHQLAIILPQTHKQLKTICTEFTKLKNKHNPQFNTYLSTKEIHEQSQNSIKNTINQTQKYTKQLQMLNKQLLEVKSNIQAVGQYRKQYENLLESKRQYVAELEERVRGYQKKEHQGVIEGVIERNYAEDQYYMRNYQTLLKHPEELKKLQGEVAQLKIQEQECIQNRDKQARQVAQLEQQVQIARIKVQRNQQRLNQTNQMQNYLRSNMTNISNKQTNKENQQRSECGRSEDSVSRVSVHKQPIIWNNKIVHYQLAKKSYFSDLMIVIVGVVLFICFVRKYM